MIEEKDGMRFISIGGCTACPECKENGYADEVGDEGHFSNSSCGLCNQHLAGQRYTWHWVDKEGNVVHEDDACVDCLQEDC